jgi:predicted small secreted protein
MRSAAVCVVVALVLAACNGSTGPGAGFECLGKPLPTTAPASLTVSGQLKANALNPAALPSAAVAAFKTGVTTALDTTTSDGGGFYTLTIASGSTPVDGYVRVSKSGYLTTYGYPAVPLSANATDNILVITSSEFGFLAGAVGVSPTPGDGFIGIVVTDCAGNALTGATVASNPPGIIHYNAAGAPSSSATATSTDGVAYIFNVAAGNVTISGTAGGHALRQHVVNARADVVTLTQIQP